MGDLGEEVGKFFRKAQDKLEEGIEKLEQNIENREGIPGKIADGMDKIADKVEEFDKSVQEKGGYKQAAKDLFSKTNMTETYKSIEDKLFTEGKYDSVKGQKILDNTAEFIKQYGTKAGNKIIDLCKGARDQVLPSWGKMKPSEEDLKGKYADIGSKYSKGVPLFTEDYENTLKFYNKASEKFSSMNSTLFGKKEEILDDIKASASATASGLVRFYKESTHITDPKGLKDNILKSSLVVKYLLDLDKNE